MRRYFVLVGLLLLTASVALAQGEYPKVETAPSFMFIRTPIAGQSFNCAGAGGTLAYNLTSFVGIAADLGGCKIFGNTIGLGNTLSGNEFTYLFGPRFTIRTSSPFQPFFEVNFGGTRLGVTCQSNAQDCNNKTGGATFSWNAFAMTAGGGFQIKVNKKISLRPFQGEYLYTRFGNNCPLAACNDNRNQNSFRLKSGIVINWGGASSN
jgi:opacity protein-like surface antigen